MNVKKKKKSKKVNSSCPTPYTVRVDPGVAVTKFILGIYDTGAVNDERVLVCLKMTARHVFSDGEIVDG